MEITPMEPNRRLVAVAPGPQRRGEELPLDVQMVGATRPNWQILLVEASSASNVDLGTTTSEAVLVGANVVSNSYGGSQYHDEPTDSNTYVNHPGVGGQRQPRRPLTWCRAPTLNGGSAILGCDVYQSTASGGGRRGRSTRCRSRVAARQ
jgi:hypothetical protein